MILVRRARVSWVAVGVHLWRWTVSGSTLTTSEWEIPRRTVRGRRRCATPNDSPSARWRAPRADSTCCSARTKRRRRTRSICVSRCRANRNSTHRWSSSAIGRRTRKRAAAGPRHSPHCPLRTATNSARQHTVTSRARSPRRVATKIELRSCRAKRHAPTNTSRPRATCSLCHRKLRWRPPTPVTPPIHDLCTAGRALLLHRPLWPTSLLLPVRFNPKIQSWFCNICHLWVQCLYRYRLYIGTVQS